MWGVLEITIVLLLQKLIRTNYRMSSSNGGKVGRDSAGKSSSLVADELIVLKQRAHDARMRTSIAARGPDVT